MKTRKTDDKPGEGKGKMWLVIILAGLFWIWYINSDEKKTEEDLCNALNEKIAAFVPALQSGKNVKELNDEMEELYGSLTRPDKQMDYEHNMTAPRGKAVRVGEQMASAAALRSIEEMQKRGNGLTPTQITQVARFYVIVDEYEKYLRKYDFPYGNTENQQ